MIRAPLLRGSFCYASVPAGADHPCKRLRMPIGCARLCLRCRVWKRLALRPLPGREEGAHGGAFLAALGRGCGRAVFFSRGFLPARCHGWMIFVSRFEKAARNSPEIFGEFSASPLGPDSFVSRAINRRPPTLQSVGNFFEKAEGAYEK